MEGIPHKSGGNNFSGSATFYYSSEDTTKVVFPDTQLKAMGVSKPEYATSDMDASGSLGGPRGRTVTIYPPSAWATANNINTALVASAGVYVEPLGTRRGQGVDTLDLRVEKEFDLGKYGRIGVYLDAFNIMGFNCVFIGQDVGGVWRPVGEGTDVGTFTPAGTYKVITHLLQFNFKSPYKSITFTCQNQSWHYVLTSVTDGGVVTPTAFNTFPHTP